MLLASAGAAFPVSMPWTWSEFLQLKIGIFPSDPLDFFLPLAPGSSCPGLGLPSDIPLLRASSAKAGPRGLEERPDGLFNLEKAKEMRTRTHW